MKELKHIFSFPSRKKLNGEYLISLGVSVAAALLVGALIMALCGHHPLEGYGAMFRGALSSPRALGDTLAKSATLCLTGLAMAVAAQAGIFNVGGEGQLYLGAMASAIVGGYLTDWSAWLVVPLALLAAMAADAQKVNSPLRVMRPGVSR